MKKITIAIDGFSSTGKSTLAKQLAAALGYVYVDTGAMYRAVAYFAMQHNLVSETHLDMPSEAPFCPGDEVHQLDRGVALQVLRQFSQFHPDCYRLQQATVNPVEAKIKRRPVLAGSPLRYM